MTRLLLNVSVVSALFLCGVAPALSADISQEQLSFFEKQVRPVLVERCYECHSADAAESELRVDSLAALLEGGSRGPAIVPGQPRQSLLIDAINHSSQLLMPPKAKLSRVEIEALTRWVEMGAPWPGETAVAPRQVATTHLEVEFTEDEKNFWAFQPPKRQLPPSVEDREWVQNPIDAFVLAKLEAAGLSPVARADKRTLIRRVAFDLTGLPPTPEEVAAFLADDSEDAFAKVVDRLLASPQYGVRWARRWLDVARYADSNGLDENLAYGNAYRYRDYVIDALNTDLPYDRFVQEQLAGDLLEYDDLPSQLSGLAATGFLCIGPKMLAEDDPVKMQMDIIDEQVDTLGRALMGLTLGCARCHDHKFDPIPTADYYSLAGIFKSTKTMENFSVVARWQERPLASPEEVQQREQQQAEIDEAQRQLDAAVAAANATLQREALSRLADYLLAAQFQRDLDRIGLPPLGPTFTPDDSKSSGILLEAEDFRAGNVKKDADSYGPGIGVILNSGELPNFVEYEFNIEEPGFYQIELRYAAAESRPCRLKVDGEPLKSDAASQTTGGWHPDHQAWFVEDVHDFTAGTHHLRIERDGPVPHFDRLLIVRVPESRLAALPARPTAKQDDEALRPIFIQQLRKYLDRVSEDKASPFRLWEHFAGEGRFSDAAHPETPLEMQLLDSTLPQSLAELANRYQQALTSLGIDPVRPPAEDGAEPASSEEKERKERKVLRQALFGEEGPFAAPPDVASLYPSSVATDVATQREKLKGLQSAKLILPTVMAVSEAKAENIPIHIRGSHVTLGDIVPRRVPRIFASERAPVMSDKGSGRLELARWLTSPDHPLTSRVMVNRVWHWHFGKGLVRTPDNFGRLGEPPTHPELLDWLALEFVRTGWSIKSLHRLIMLSSTYQMSTVFNSVADAEDPENRLWWRMNRRRLEAEEIRDAMLLISGTLDPAMGGTLLPTPNRNYVTSTANVNPVTYETRRRSLYLPVVRSAVFEMFQAFDFADPAVLSGERATTTVAPQALFMMNSQFVSAIAGLMAKQLGSSNPSKAADRIHQLYQRALSRPADVDEIEEGLTYIDQLQAALTARGHAEEEARSLAWQSLCRTVLASNEFLFVE